MEEFIYQIAPYAPIAIFLASVLDIFFVTGLVLYGGAMLGTVGMMIMTGMVSIPEVIIAALAGTLTGNQINYWIGRYFNTKNFVRKRLESERAQKAESFLRSRGLFLFMIVGSFVTFFRPVHGLILGAFNIRWWRFFIYDLFISLLWVVFWLIVILQGERIYHYLFG